MLGGRPGPLSVVAGACLVLVLAGAWSARAADWSGSVTGQWRYFPQDPLRAEQFRGSDFALVFDAEFSHVWDNGRQVFVFNPLLRLDREDSERSRADIAELSWVRAGESWEWRLGVRKVFWGVTEFAHLVDIVNQSDLAENLDAEEKLGQPMVNLAWIGDWGTLDLFVLPGFRERVFPGREGRLHGGVPVATDQAEFESGAENQRTDLALRWFHTVGNWDLALSHFYGTRREPELSPGLDGAGRLVLVPRYSVIHQTGLELQYTGDAWLWKLEAIRQSGGRDSYMAATGGFEYTLVGIMDSAADLGLIGELIHDERGDQATTFLENDLVLGARLNLNDVQSTSALVGMVIDLDGAGQFYTVEASRRLGDNFKLSLEARFGTDIARADQAFSLRNEDFLTVDLAWFF